MDEYDLYDMEVNEISSVTRGDNRGAKILMFKSRPGEGDPPGDDDPGDLSWVEDFVKSEAGAEEAPGDKGGEAESEGIVKGVLGAIGKVLGLSPEQIEKAEESYKPPDYEQIERGRMAGVIREEIALKVSSFFDAMMMAVEVGDGGDAMRASASQFAADMESSIGAWSQGRSSMGKAGRKLAAGRRRRLVEAVERLAAIVNETAPQETRKNEPSTQEVTMKLTMEKAKEMGLDLTEEQLAEINKVHAEADPEEVAKAAGADPEEVEFQKMMKNADPGMRSYLEKQRADQKADREKVARMEKAQEIGKYTEIAKSAGMAKPEERAEDLYKLAQTDPEAVEKVVAEASAANARLKAAGLFSEVSKGASDGGSGSATDKAKAKAAELRKADPKLTQAQAMSKAWEDEDLAEQYEQERAS